MSLPPIHDDAASEATSNPSAWEGHMPRKMKDLEWNFSAGPLRVSDCNRKQWDRLHATYKAVLPRPDGTLEEFVHHIPHTSDDELLKVVAQSGVAQPRRRFNVHDLPQAPKREVNTPLLRERLAKNTVPPLPKRPTAAPLDDDCTSIFSTTTVLKPISVASVGSRVSRGSHRSTKVSQRTASTGVSAASKTSTQLRQQLAEEHDRQEALRTKLAAASERLAALEAASTASQS